MQLKPVDQDPQKWIDFYKASMNGFVQKKIQRGRGGTLGPCRGRGTCVPVEDVVTRSLVTPTEQVVQQAKSEVDHQQSDNIAKIKRSRGKRPTPYAVTTKKNGLY